MCVHETTQHSHSTVSSIVNIPLLGKVIEGGVGGGGGEASD